MSGEGGVIPLPFARITPGLFGDYNMKTAPLRTSDFGLAQHRFRQFSATVSSDTTKEQLSDPALWASVAPQMQPGDSIRVIAEDFSFIAVLVVTFSQGTVARVKVLTVHGLDKVEQQQPGLFGDYELKMRGPKKWCIVKTSTGEVIKEGIPTQTEAVRELADYQQALVA